MGCVYYIFDSQYVKIGFTFNLRERLSTLQVANSRQLIVMKTELCQYPHIREQYLHKKYKYNWFLLGRLSKI